MIVTIFAFSASTVKESSEAPSSSTKKDAGPLGSSSSGAGCTTLTPGLAAHSRRSFLTKAEVSTLYELLSETRLRS